MSAVPPSLPPRPVEPAQTGPPGPVPDLDALSRDLNDVEAALRRLDQGSYGVCEVCRTEIDPDIVVACPAARRCPGHGGPLA